MRSQKHYPVAIVIAERLGLVAIAIEHGGEHPRICAKTTAGKPVHAGFPSSPGAHGWAYGLRKRLQRAIRARDGAA